MLMDCDLSHQNGSTAAHLLIDVSDSCHPTTKVTIKFINFIN